MELYRWYILKYGAYALLAVALFRLQSIPGLLEIGGVRPRRWRPWPFWWPPWSGSCRRIVLHLLRVSV